MKTDTMLATTTLRASLGALLGLLLAVQITAQGQGDFKTSACVRLHPWDHHYIVMIRNKTVAEFMHSEGGDGAGSGLKDNLNACRGFVEDRELLRYGTLALYYDPPDTRAYDYRFWIDDTGTKCITNAIDAAEKQPNIVCALAPGL
ncbi:MAG: hypothetical protein M1838_003198 [Thelocarpon superellum]|nr:MAG: hypothetical protein M1838_003198 [Thelocarpon superellum]